MKGEEVPLSEMSIPALKAHLKTINKFDDAGFKGKRSQSWIKMFREERLAIYREFERRGVIMKEKGP